MSATAATSIPWNSASTPNPSTASQAGIWTSSGTSATQTAMTSV
jgi:hypothetical protein